MADWAVVERAGPAGAMARFRIAVADAYATTAVVPLAVAAPGLMANDLDPDGTTFNVTSVTQPSNGQLTSAVTNGAFTYEPNAGFTGTDEFTYVLRDADGKLSDPGTVTIEVLPEPNRAPVGIDDSYGTMMGVPLTVAAPGVLANDVDPDGDGITVSNVTQPTNGQLTSAVTNGAFTYVPNPGYTGPDEFTYIFRDSRSAISSPVTVRIEVFAPGGTIPIGIPDAYATIENTPLMISAPGLLANDLDPDGGSPTVTSVTQPSHGQLTSAVTNGAFTYVPQPGFTGTDQFTYILRDADNNLSAATTVTIEVMPDPNRAPIGITDHYATLKDATLTIAAPGLLANDVDPDGDAINVTSVTQPSHGQLTSAVTNGAFTYVPNPGFTGADQFTYILRDDRSAMSKPVTVHIDVVTDDVTPPEIVVPTDAIRLWPPNHRYETIRVEDLVSAIVDADPGVVPADVVIVSVTSDEVDNDGSDGNTVDDIVIGAQCRSVNLRRERIEGGNGRVYVIGLAVADASGNVGEAFVRVHMPGERMSAVTEEAPANVVYGSCGTF